MGARTAFDPPDPGAQPSQDLRHDARNLLQVIEGYLELIAGRASDPVLLRYSANAHAATEQLIALAHQLPGAAEATAPADR